MTSFSKNTLNTFTTDQLSGQLFATLAMFYFSPKLKNIHVSIVKIIPYLDHNFPLGTELYHYLIK